MVSPTEASSDDSEQEEVPKVLPPEAWRPCPDPKVFKDLLLEWRCLEEADTVEDDEEEARHGVGERSFVRLFVEPQPSEHCLSAPLGAVEFFLGEESGYQCIQEESSDTRPPQELNRLDIPRWLTEAALCLRFAGAQGRFRSREGRPDLIGEHHVRLIAVQRGSDLLGDGAILLRQLRVGSGPRPRDAATVRACWRAWFQRNLELIFSTGDPENPAEAVEVVIDEDEVMAALQLGLKHLKAGSRGLLRVSADWGIGQLLPSGGPTLRSAAIWIDICMHEVQNPPLPGELQDLQSCLEFVEHRKVQGNGHLANGDAASIARATRRYEEGIAALAGLKEAPASAAALLAALRRNLALAHLRRGRWADAESVCSAVLQEGLDSKAFFRRGAARLGLEDFDGAVEDLREALGLASETEVPAVRRELAKAQARRKEWQQGQRKAFQGVFDKMTLQDEAWEKRQKEAEEKAKEEEARLLHEQEREKESLAPSTPEVAETQPEEDNITAKVSAMVEPPASGAIEPEQDEAADFRNVTLPKRPQETGITALMPPPGARISQAPPKVENYQVPSFLRKKQQKKP